MLQEPRSGRVKGAPSLGIWGAVSATISQGWMLSPGTPCKTEAGTACFPETWGAFGGVMLRTSTCVQRQVQVSGRHCGRSKEGPRTAASPSRRVGAQAPARSGHTRPRPWTSSCGQRSPLRRERRCTEQTCAKPPPERRDSSGPALGAPTDVGGVMWAPLGVRFIGREIVTVTVKRVHPSIAPELDFPFNYVLSAVPITRPQLQPSGVSHLPV